MTSIRLILPAIAAAIVLPLPVAAQSREQGDRPLASFLKTVVARAVTLSDAPPPPEIPEAIVHEAHFLAGANLSAARGELNKAIAVQLATFPLSSSSGGFSYTVDPSTGAVRPMSATFGPLFAERALTIGEGQFNFGLTYQHVTYDSFEGVDLRSGDMRFYLQHNNCCGSAAGPADPNGPGDLEPFFERDLMETTLGLQVDTNSVAFFGTYGVTDDLDVGLAIPIVSVSLDATATAEIVRTATGAIPPLHSFDGHGGGTNTIRSRASATGLGDVVLRGKYAFYRAPMAAVAAGLDIRLPTGDRNDLLGTGASQAKLYFIGSSEIGRFSPHVNFGYTFSSGNVSPFVDQVVGAPDVPYDANTPDVSAVKDLAVPDEINYAFGVNAAVLPRVTMAFDIVGRTLRDVPRFTVGRRTFESRTPGPLPSTPFQGAEELVFETTTGNMNLVLGAFGWKINVTGTLLLNMSFLVPMNDSGLQPDITPHVGFDYVF